MLLIPLEEEPKQEDQLTKFTPRKLYIPPLLREISNSPKAAIVILEKLLLIGITNIKVGVTMVAQYTEAISTEMSAKIVGVVQQRVYEEDMELKCRQQGRGQRPNRWRVSAAN